VVWLMNAFGQGTVTCGVVYGMTLSRLNEKKDIPTIYDKIGVECNVKITTCSVKAIIYDGSEHLPLCLCSKI